MNRGPMEQIADAVLYEGYILYPYRPSALKNRHRWNFGGLCPRAYCEAQNGAELWSSQTQCLAIAKGDATIHGKLRFLHLVKRRVARMERVVADISECTDSDFIFVDGLEIDGRLYQAWDEATEREIELPQVELLETSEGRPDLRFHLSGARTLEPLRNRDGKITSVLVREQNAIDGAAHIQIKSILESLFLVTLQVSNATHFPDLQRATRDEAMMHSLASSHAILSIRNGEFVSLLDPPAEFATFASQCRNIGTYPVLVGGEGDCSTMLSSPVILYDYPKISPESRGDLFDGTEIDEILTLRILALTDQEKSEMRECDERARRILDRIESDPEHLSRLHGTMRSVDSTEGAHS